MLARPRLGRSRRRPGSKPTPSSTRRSSRPAAARLAGERHLLRFRVPCDVAEPLLRDAEEAERRLPGRRRPAVPDVERDRHGFELRETLGLRPQRLGQTEVVERRGVQLIREGVHVLGQTRELLAQRAARHRVAAGAGAFHRNGGGILEPGRIDRQPRQALAEIVVQLARDRLALLLLRVEQAAIEDVHALLCQTAPGALHEEGGDEERLDQDDSDRDENGIAVRLPESGRAEPQLAPRRQAGKRNVEAFELAPVVRDDDRHRRRHRDVCGGFALEEPQRDFRRPARLPGDGHERSSDDAVAELLGEPAEDGRLRDRPQSDDSLLLLVHDARRVHLEAAVQDRRAGPQGRRAAPHLFEREAVPPLEVTARGERRQLALELVLPEMLERRGAEDDGEMRRAGEEAEDVLDDAGGVVDGGDGDVVRLERKIRQLAALEAGHHGRHVGEGALPRDEVRRRSPDGHDEIETMVRHECPQVVGQRALPLARRGESRDLERGLEELDGGGPAVDDGRAERRGVGLEGSEAAAERCDDQDTARLGVGGADGGDRRREDRERGRGDPQEKGERGAVVRGGRRERLLEFGRGKSTPGAWSRPGRPAPTSA